MISDIDQNSLNEILKKTQIISLKIPLDQRKIDRAIQYFRFNRVTTLFILGKLSTINEFLSTLNIVSIRYMNHLIGFYIF